MIPITETIFLPEEELEWSFARSGGPGGQNVNKVASKAILRWKFATNTTVPPEVKERFQTKFPSRVTVEGDVIITSQKTRDQDRNKEDCVEKLVALVQAAMVVPKARKKTKPSKASKARRVAAKRHNASNRSKRQIPND